MKRYGKTKSREHSIQIYKHKQNVQWLYDVRLQAQVVLIIVIKSDVRSL